MADTRLLAKHLAHKKKKHFIQGAIKRPGALTAAVGGKPSQHMGQVEALAKSGSPLQRKQAEFYMNVLRK